MAKRKFLTALFLIIFLFLSFFTEIQHQEPEQVRLQDREQVEIKIAKGRQAVLKQKETKEYREGLAAYIQSVNNQVTDEEAGTMVDSILDCSEQYGVDDKLVMAVAHTESTYYSDAVSTADYKGLMQTGDVLAEEAGYEPEDLFEPEISITVGTGYIDEQMETFGDTRLALTAYNQGAGTVYSGCYDTAYADVTMERAADIEVFLEKNGYVR